jgi:hypothetical protein
MIPAIPPHVHLLATLALEHAIVEEWAEARALFADLVAEHGAAGLFTCLTSWADSVIAAQPVTVGPGAVVALNMINADTGVSGDEHVPPEALWAGRYMAARAARDLDTTLALNAAAKASGKMDECALAVLVCAATTVRQLRRDEVAE